MGKNMEKVNFIGGINHFIKANFSIIIFMDKVYTIGLMVVNIRGLGNIIKCKVKEYFNGQMEESILENIYKIKSMDMANLSGRMVENILVIG